MYEPDNLKKAANPLLCDVETGLCEIPADRLGTRATAVQAAQKNVFRQTISIRLT